jgi:hypothetical protein
MQAGLRDSRCSSWANVTGAITSVRCGICVALSALLGAAAALLVILIVNGSIGSVQTRKVEPFSLVRDPKAGELAERFRPWLMFDSREKWRPLNVDYMFDEGTQRFCRTEARAVKCEPHPIRNVTEFDRLVEGKQAGPTSFVDIAGDTTDSYHGPASCRPLLDCDRGPRSAIYYHVTESNDRFYIDYWWFLRFNHFERLGLDKACHLGPAREAGVCDEHEGDWEGVTVVTHDEKNIEYVVYAAHKGTFRYSGHPQLQVREKTHPVVYLAEGSHAAYPLACASACHQPPALAIDGVVEMPEASYDGLAPWGRNAESCVPNAAGSCLFSLDKQHWTHWQGEWGAGCAAACDGVRLANSPHSPGVQQRYQTPWCSFEEEVFTCDGRSQRCADWLSAEVVAVACDPNLLTKAQRSSKKQSASVLALEMTPGKPIRSTATPSVVQALGDPLEPGSRMIAVVDGPNAEVLVRAAQGRLVSVDRFTDANWRSRQMIHLTVTSGTDGPTVLADGRRAVERTITERPPPKAITRALQNLATRR